VEELRDSSAYPRTSQFFRKLTFATAIFYILAPGTRVFFRYSPGLPWLVWSIYGFSALVVAYLVILENRLKVFQQMLRNPWFIVFIFFTALVVTWYGYPIADGLKLQMQGSDQDDCVIISASRLARLRHPYMERSYLGNACSTGFGLLVLYMPFVLLHIYQLGAVFAILSVTICLYAFHGKLESVGLFLALLLSCVLIPELLVVGSDLILIGCGIALFAMMVTRAVERRSWVYLLILAVLCGLLASSRVNFLVLVPLMGMLVFMHWRIGAAGFFVVALLTAVVPSALIYFVNPQEFTPLHLLGKGQGLIPRPFLEITACVSAVAALVGTYLVKKNISFVPWAVFFSLAPGLVAVSIGDLAARSGNIGQWEGANYFVPLVPLAAVLLVSLKRQSPAARD
jgi:hypothetical protein